MSQGSGSGLQNLERYACHLHGEHSLKKQVAIYEGNRWIDAFLYCRGQKFGVHRAVVGVYSGYLEKMFDELDGLGPVQPVISLNDLTPEVLGLILKFIYSGKVDIPADKVQLFFRTCEYLDLTCGDVREKELEGHRRMTAGADRSVRASSGRGGSASRKRRRSDGDPTSEASSDEDDSDTYSYGPRSRRPAPGSAGARKRSRGRGGKRGQDSRPTESARRNAGESASSENGASSENDSLRVRAIKNAAAKMRGCSVALERLDPSRIRTNGPINVEDFVDAGAAPAPPPASVPVPLSVPEAPPPEADDAIMLNAVEEPVAAEGAAEMPDSHDDEGIQVEMERHAAAVVDHAHVHAEMNGVPKVNGTLTMDSGLEDSSPEDPKSRRSNTPEQKDVFDGMSLEQDPTKMFNVDRIGWTCIKTMDHNEDRYYCIFKSDNGEPCHFETTQETEIRRHEKLHFKEARKMGKLQCPNCAYLCNTEAERKTHVDQSHRTTK